MTRNLTHLSKKRNNKITKDIKPALRSNDFKHWIFYIYLNFSCLLLIQQGKQCNCTNALYSIWAAINYHTSHTLQSTIPIHRVCTTVPAHSKFEELKSAVHSTHSPPTGRKRGRFKKLSKPLVLRRVTRQKWLLESQSGNCVMHAKRPHCQEGCEPSKGKSLTNLMKPASTPS